MENLQSSTHYNHVSDPVSLEGLDDFLDGLLDKVFDPELKQTTNLRVLRKDSTEDKTTDTNGGVTEDSEICLDDLFEPDDIIGSGSGIFAPSYGQSKSDRPSLFEADPDATVEMELKIRFLEAQLDYRNRELRESFNRLRFLEGQIQGKDDQLRLIPELIKRGAVANQYEHDLVALRDNLEAVSEELRDTQHVLESLRGNWIGKLSLWMAGAKE